MATKGVSRCPHVQSVGEWTWQQIIQHKQGKCETCNIHVANLWLCLIHDCQYIGCGEAIQDHSLSHAQTKKHPLAMNLTTMRVWCIECNHEVFPNSNTPSFTITGVFTQSASKNTAKTAQTTVHTTTKPTATKPTPTKPTQPSTMTESAAQAESDSDTEQLCYKPRGLTGLRNLGNTCYMNAALQALSNCQPLTQFFLDCPGFVRPEKHPQLSKSHLRLVTDVWHKKRPSYVVPSSVYNGIKLVHPMFRGYTQQDTQEFLRCFMDQLHEELKSPKAIDSDDNDQTDCVKSAPISNSPIHHSRKPSVDSSASSQSEVDYETCDSGLSSDRSSVEMYLSGDENLETNELSRLNSPVGRELKNYDALSSSGSAKNLPGESLQSQNNDNVNNELKPEQNSDNGKLADHHHVKSERVHNKTLVESRNVLSTCHSISEESENLLSGDGGDSGGGGGGGIGDIGGGIRGKISDIHGNKVGGSLDGSIDSNTCANTSVVHDLVDNNVITETDKLSTSENDNSQSVPAENISVTDTQNIESLPSQNVKNQSDAKIDLPHKQPDTKSESPSGAKVHTKSNDLRKDSKTTDQSHETKGDSSTSSAQSKGASPKGDNFESAQKTISVQSFVSSDSGVSSIQSLRSHYSLPSSFVPYVRKNVQYRSVISDIFDGKILSSVQCTTCERISTTKETFQDLSLPIPNKDHINTLHSAHPGALSVSTCGEVNPSWLTWFVGWMKSWFVGLPITLQDCLAAFFSADDLKGENMYSCEKCNKLRNGMKFSKVLQLPEILCIHLKRFRHEFMFSSKISSNVSFPVEDLDMTPYLHKDCRNEVTLYDLIAVICHHGTAGGGHYTSYCQNFINNQWYEFDDQYVTEVDVHAVLNCEAYVLFYRKKDDNMSILRQKGMALLDLPEDSLLPFYISKQWVNKFNTFAEPGPIDNTDFMCSHGGVHPTKIEQVEELVIMVQRPLWTFLYEKFGGGPACTRLFVCNTCQEEMEKLQQRQKYEMEMFLMLVKQSKCEEQPEIFYLSMQWFKDWENFVHNKTDEPPGPINNRSISVMKNGQPTLRKCSDNCQISQQMWVFLHDIYGGGPELHYS